MHFKELLYQLHVQCFKDITIYSVTTWLIDWLTDWLTNWLIDWLIDWLIEQCQELTNQNVKG